MPEIDHRIALAGRGPQTADPMQMLGLYLKGRRSRRQEDLEKLKLGLAGRKMQQEGRKLDIAERKVTQQDRKLALDQQKAELDQAEQRLKIFGSVAFAIKQRGSTPEAIQWGKQVLAQQGYDVSGVSDAMTPADVDSFIMMSMDAGERLKAEKLRLDQEYRESEIPRAVAKQEALLPGQIEVARQRGAAGAERQAQAQIRAAEIEKSAKPLTGAAAKEFADLEAAFELATDIGDLMEDRFVGKVGGTGGAVREFTGQISDEEVEFRQIVADVKDSLLRARSGAAITESEYRRLSRITPNVTDMPRVFKAKLRRFKKNLRTVMRAKRKIATTGRGELGAPPVATPPGTAAAPAPAAMPANDPLGIRR